MPDRCDCGAVGPAEDFRVCPGCKRKVCVLCWPRKLPADKADSIFWQCNHERLCPECLAPVFEDFLVLTGG